MAAISTTVDLSRLPAPIVVEQLTFDQIVDQMVATLRVKLPAFDATVDSDPGVKVLHVAAYRELIVRQAFQDGALQLFVAYATGARLDHLAALVGVTRQIVTPANPATGAAAIYEDDDRLRQRIVLAPEGFSVAGPELAYVKHAKDASADVLDASAISTTPGEVLVSVLNRSGDGTAPAVLLAKVTAIVNDPGIRPLGDLVTVASARIVPFVVTARLLTFSGPDPDLIVATARDALVAFLAENRKLGRTITRSGLMAALSPKGVHRVDLDLDADVVCDATQAAYCTAIAVSHGGIAS
ncbi:phage-related baseplate assembly protein [Sphingomonas sp. PP-F2F-G114-C0414]|uniref:baseplate assembly protein n=1 Tax=Sphingomonas sp. PP-F2F-G114-C0414 TaxID=2135662 RepID=UPI000EF8F1B2|nr:baseplate J/gp47 family protein [Sphingomonas sp. PP-F2F-G114-C0414]RMB26249.1 phage-related baseplate assembly protein [Sphingomonas sp. PP-F2F-G114-C0414]